MSASAPTTAWTVRPSPGLEAVLFVGILSGDVLQSEIYSAERDEVWPQLSANVRSAIARLDQGMRFGLKKLTGPVMAHMLSAGGDSTLAAVVAGAKDPERLLEPSLRLAPGWDRGDTRAIFELMPHLASALEGLQVFGFEDWYDTRFRPDVEAAADAMQDRLKDHDIIPLQSRLLGRVLSPVIEINPTFFSKPYGISVYGQRFLAHYENDAETQLRIAAHEIFHPPFQRTDQELVAGLADLEADPWMCSIVENHDPAFGYNSFWGIVDEDSTQALDQIVSEQLGVARDPGDRWRKADDGMHLLAAALYHAMAEDGFGDTGGRYADWLKAALDRGMLTPDEVRRRAAAFVGESAVRKWHDIASGGGPAPD